MRARVMLGRVLPLFAAVGFAGCETAPEPPTRAEITNEVEALAIVRAIDPESRKVTLERDDGAQLVVVAGSEVRNFDSIAVGDRIRARYAEVLSARRLSPEEATTEPSFAAAAERSDPGGAPAVTVGAGVAFTVRVESVDLDQHLVVFVDPTGRLRAARAQRDEGKAFVAGLEPGDRVELVAGETLALVLE